jgi:hypothetical protein
MAEPMSYTRGSGGAGGFAGNAPSGDRQGSAIDSVISRLESLINAISHITGRVEQVATSTLGVQPSAVPNTKIDHPPTTLQEWVSHLEDKITALDHQVTRLF